MVEGSLKMFYKCFYNYQLCYSGKRKTDRERLAESLQIAHFEIYQREEVPVKWGTFADPWGNRIFFEHLDEAEKAEKLNRFSRDK